MALPEGIASAQRSGRQGRAKAVGGRRRLPGLRVSGAAMALSTVIGISLATTWLADEQGRVGRLPEVSSVDVRPSLPSPNATGQPADCPTPATRPAASPTPGGPTAAGSSTGRPGAAPRPSDTRATGPAGPAARAAGQDGAQPAAPVRPVPPVTPPATPPITPLVTPLVTPAVTPPAMPPRSEVAAKAIFAAVERLGPAGSRPTLTVTVTEPLAAIEAALRLDSSPSLPGALRWTGLPGTVVTTVVTVRQEHSALVYGFTDVPPGR